MLDHDTIAEKILTIIPDCINLIVVFGSQARGDHSEHSDLDIAISTSHQDEKRRFELRLEVISLFEGPRNPVDVVIIEDSNWTLRHRIAKDGKVLYQKNEDSWANFIEQVLIHYPDYRIFEKKFLEDALGGA